jgi:hypothetical protein
MSTQIAAALETILSGTIEPGLYRWGSRRSAGSIAATVEAAGWRCFHLDGAYIITKLDFFTRCAEVMQFPPYFGRNWDAFEECITDLSWVPAAGYLLLYDDPDPFAEAAPEDWLIACTVLSDISRYWLQQGRPFFSLLRATGIAHAGIPRLYGR